MDEIECYMDIDLIMLPKASFRTRVAVRDIKNLTINNPEEEQVEVRRTVVE